MSTTNTLNSNRKKAAIYLAHNVIKTKKPVTDEVIHKAAELYMENPKPKEGVMAVIRTEVKRLLTECKGKVEKLPEVPAPLGTVKPVPAKKEVAPAAKKKGKAGKAEAVVAKTPAKKVTKTRKLAM